MTEIGNSLREARIRKGLSIKDVEDRTKVRGRYLEALENDDFEVLPGPVYVKAFLRTYATFLKLDADALVTQYRSTYHSEHEQLPSVTREVMKTPKGRTRSRSRSQSRSRPAPLTPPGGDKRRGGGQRRSPRGYALLAFVAIVVVAALAWYYPGRSHKATIDASSLTSSTITSTTSGGPGTSGGTGDSTASTSTSVGSSSSTSAGQTQEASAATTLPGANLSFKIHVNSGSCWLIVHENSSGGAELYAGTLSAGGELTFASAKAYWVTLGAPEVVTVTLNGKSGPVSGAPGSFLVTETGLQRTESST